MCTTQVTQRSWRRRKPRNCCPCPGVYEGGEGQITMPNRMVPQSCRTVAVPKKNSYVTNAGRDAWKAWYGASLLDHTKLKKETEPYVAHGFIYTVARGSITRHGAYVWQAVAP